MTPSVEQTTRGTRRLRVLPVDVYEALHLSALAFGGIGAEEISVGGSPVRAPDEWNGFAPCCIHGHALSAEDLANVSWGSVLSTMSRKLESAHISGAISDWAVKRINKRQSRRLTHRVTFEDWCHELNVVPVADPMDGEG